MENEELVMNCFTIDEETLNKKTKKELIKMIYGLNESNKYYCENYLVIFNEVKEIRDKLVKCKKLMSTIHPYLENYTDGFSIPFTNYRIVKKVNE